MSRRAAGRRDRRLVGFRAGLAAAADPEHAAFHRRYHKSELRFHGLRNEPLRALVRTCCPRRPKPDRDDALGLVRALWSSDWFEERQAALLLLERHAAMLVPDDLPWLGAMTRDCAGWAHLDLLAVKVLGALALARPDAVYPVVRGWSDDSWMWSRRAAILVHVLPARRRQLDQEVAFTTFDERLHETEFFIRKAIGWALREACRHYPQEVYDFLARAGDRASGLTRREGARKLPEALRLRLLGR